MIARVDFGYNGQQRLLDLAKSDEMYARLKEMLPEAPDPENRERSYAWPRESLIELETDGRWLTDNGVTFEVKKFKGTTTVAAIFPDGSTNVVHVHVPNVGLLSIAEVMVEENACTDLLQRRLNEGWRILCVCPPNAARRPDYILGRTKEKE